MAYLRSAVQNHSPTSIEVGGQDRLVAGLEEEGAGRILTGRHSPVRLPPPAQLVCSSRYWPCFGARRLARTVSCLIERGPAWCFSR